MSILKFPGRLHRCLLQILLRPVGLVGQIEPDQLRLFGLITLAKLTMPSLVTALEGNAARAVRSPSR